MSAPPLTPDELRDLLATILAGAAGGDATAWLKLIGPVTRVHLAVSPATNWALSPTGTPAKRKVVAQAIGIVRAEHPYVLW